MTPLAWLGILAILLVIEAITVGLTTVWIAGGALEAALKPRSTQGTAQAMRSAAVKRPCGIIPKRLMLLSW